MPAARRSRRVQNARNQATRTTRRAAARVERSPSPTPDPVENIDVAALTPEELSSMCVAIKAELDEYSDLRTPSFRKLFKRDIYPHGTWICAICGVACGRTAPSDLGKHLFRHYLRKDLPYGCDQCDLRSGQRSNINEHVKRMHNKPKDNQEDSDSGSDVCGVILAERAPDGGVLVCGSVFGNAVKRCRHKNKCHFPKVKKGGRRTQWLTLNGDEPSVTIIKTKKGQFRLGLYRFKGDPVVVPEEVAPQEPAARATAKKVLARQPKQTARAKLPARPTVQKKASPEPQLGPIRTVRRSARLAPYRFAPFDEASDQDEAEVLTHLTVLSPSPSPPRSPLPELEQEFEPEFEPEPEPAPVPEPPRRSRANAKGKGKAPASRAMANAQPEEPSISAGPSFSFYYKNSGAVISPEAEKENEEISRRIQQGFFSYVPPSAA